MRFCQAFMTELYRHIVQTSTSQLVTSVLAAVKSVTPMVSIVASVVHSKNGVLTQ